MTRILLSIVAAICGIYQVKAGQEKMQTLHVSNSFHFVIGASPARIAPLFGPEGERQWAGKHWNPEFIYPGRAADVQGAVFTIQHGPYTSTWVNTVFDISAGRMQYVYFIPDHLVTVVTVALTQIDESHTRVNVTYDHTALRPEANDDVRMMEEHERESGPEWRAAIEACLTPHKK